MTEKPIRFGLSIMGSGMNIFGWKHSSSPVDASVNLPFTIEMTKKAESNGIAFAFVGDGLYVHENSVPHQFDRFEPLTLLSALAAVTKRIGLVATVSTSFSEPFTVARQFASLDLISGGRAGWNAITSAVEGAGRNYSRPLPEHDLRYEIAAEHLAVVQGLWNSWDGDAFPRDRQSGVFFRKESFRRLNHKGRFFQVEGPLNVARSPQGQPVLVQAGASDAGIEVAGRFAEVVFTSAVSLDDNLKFTRKVEDAARKHGRTLDDIRIFPGMDFIVGATDEEAHEKLHEIRGLISIEAALHHLSLMFGYHDFDVYPLDAPFPDLGEIGDNNIRSFTGRIKTRAREQGQTLREAVLEFVLPKPHFIGSGEKVAEEIIRWVDSGAADGFILGPQVVAGLDDFIEYVIPALERRGRYQRDLRGETLRDHLGLRQAGVRKPTDAQRVNG